VDAGFDPYRLRDRGITDSRVLAAMAVVPRAEFIPPEHRHEVRGDYPLPLGYGQTISQPFIVAWMTQELDVGPGARVLEVGTGSGYQTAILAELGADVYSIEIVAELGEQAERTLSRLGYGDRVHLRIGSGYGGWPEAAPFDRILLTAAPPSIPEALTDQLADGGRLLGPVGINWQTIVIVDNVGGALQTRESLPVRFVPMVQ
jgi:protein-L-isoaspartate(D-aspartate) O-methyltransferase